MILFDNMDLAEDFIRYVIGLCHGAQPGRPGIPGQRLVDEEKQKPQQERSDMGLIEKTGICAQ